MKKPRMYQDPGALWLSTRCSKAALVDLAIELLRVRSGRCDEPITEAVAQDAIAPILRARGDSVYRAATGAGVSTVNRKEAVDARL